MADDLTHPYNRRRVLTIDDLPDDDLLAIFDFYAVRYQDPDLIPYLSRETKRDIESWQSLVHVCRRWRCLVFGSPRRLNLQLYCTARTFARKSLDVWPALPLLIEGEFDESSVDNVIAGLEHSDRIRQIDLNYLGCHITSQIKKLWTAMQVLFPELTRLYLYLSVRVVDGPWPVLPDSFLDGSAPRLRFLYLNGILFPGLPKLLLSATHLVDLYLHSTRSISPEAMATSLSMLTSLKTLRLDFKPPRFSPDLKNQRPFLPARPVLPTLTNFWFKGTNEYLEEFVARIDAPRLYRLETTFINEIDFNTPELGQFISRTRTLVAYDQAYLNFGSGRARVRLCQSHPGPFDHRIRIICQGSDRRLSTLAKIFTLSLRRLLTMENLYISGYPFLPPDWVLRGDDSENTEWLNFLLPFTAVKNLYLSRPFAPHIARALQELTEGRTTEVLPALQNVFLEEFQTSEPVHEGIAQFVSARKLTDHPVAIIRLASVA